MTDDASHDSGAHELVVRRSGGIAGTVKTGRIDLESDTRGTQARALLDRIDLHAAAAVPSPPRPDGFVYAISADGANATVGETQLTDDLSALVRLALDGAG